jgi:hypothetical protein
LNRRNLSRKRRGNNTAGRARQGRQGMARQAGHGKVRQARQCENADVNVEQNVTRNSLRWMMNYAIPASKSSGRVSSNSVPNTNLTAMFGRVRMISRQEFYRRKFLCKRGDIN